VGNQSEARTKERAARRSKAALSPPGNKTFRLAFAVAFFHSFVQLASFSFSYPAARFYEFIPFEPNPETRFPARTSPRLVPASTLISGVYLEFNHSTKQIYCFAKDEIMVVA
jgi:hypothetical protein